MKGLQTKFMKPFPADQTKCPVCGKAQLEYMEICPVCEWQNDMVQLRHPDWGGGANRMSLEKAREAYRKGMPIE